MPWDSIATPSSIRPWTPWRDAAKRCRNSDPSEPIGSPPATLRVYNRRMVVVHHLNNSRSQRVLWLLEELGVPYEVQRYERDAKTMQAPPALLAIHPLGKSPVIVDGSVTVAESGAVVEYLIDRYGAGRLIPATGTRERLRYTYWLHYA